MGHALAKERLCRADFVDMRVEMVAAEVGEIDNIGFGNGAAGGQQTLANDQLFKMFTERMNRIFFDCRAIAPLFAHCGQHRRAALNCGTLHVMFYRPQAA
ncbi:hypothetical protein D3C75_665070 [compost metagenome]